MVASDLVVSYQVSRDTDHGGPDPLHMNDWNAGETTGIAIVRGGLTLGGKVRRNYSIDGEGTNGSMLIGSELAMVPSVLVVRLYGTPAQREALRAQIANAGETGAFDQFSYTITVTVAGIERQYRCWPADIIPGADGALDEFSEMAGRELLTISFLRRPKAIEGSF